VLEQIAETRLNRAFVAGVDVEVIGNRAHLTDRAVRLGEHRTRRVAVPGARGFELFERPEARVQPGDFLFAGAHGTRPPFVLDARAGQFRFAAGSRHARRFESRLRAPKRLRGDAALGLHARRLDADVGGLDVELRERVRDAV